MQYYANLVQYNKFVSLTHRALCLCLPGDSFDT